MINNNTVSAINFNHSVLGSTGSRRRVASLLPSDITSIYSNSSNYLSKINSTKMEYLQLYYDDLYSINTGYLKGMADKDVFAALKEKVPLKDILWLT